MKQSDLTSFFRVSQDPNKRKRPDFESGSVNGSISQISTNQSSEEKNNNHQPYTLPPVKIESEVMNNIPPAQPRNDDSDEEQNVVLKQTRKIRKIGNDDDEEGNDDYKPSKMDIDMQEYGYSGSSNRKSESGRGNISVSKLTEEKPKSTSKGLATPKFGSMSGAKTPSSGGQTNGKPAKVEQDDAINIEEDQNNKKASLNDLTDKTPWWATAEQMLDKKKRKPGDPGFDSNTLYIPDSQFNKLTPTMKQFWQIKSENMDKIIFFQLGKFYELFYEDALVSHQILDLNWMGSKMHTGFPEKVLEQYATTLVECGYQVAVVEQMETPAQMEERVQQQKTEKQGVTKTINREIVNVHTKGTYVSAEMSFEPRYLLTIRYHSSHSFGVCIIEASTNMIIIGHIQDDLNSTLFKMMMCQVKPLEVVYDPDNIPSTVMRILKSGYIVPVLSPLSSRNNNKWHRGTAMNIIEHRFSNFDEKQWPAALSHFYQDSNKRDLVFQALSGSLEYLKQILILEDVLEAARFQLYDPVTGIRNSMILDSQALLHLEILESTSISNKDQKDMGSLFSYIDHTCTPFGKRMLKNWLCAPLMNIDKIYQRYDAIEDLNKYRAEMDQFRNNIRKMPDLERLCARIYQYSVVTNTKKNAVYFEDISQIRLKQFRDLLSHLRFADSLIKANFSPNSNKFTSQRLRALTTIAEPARFQKQNHNSDLIYPVYDDGEAIVIDSEDEIMKMIEETEDGVPKSNQKPKFEGLLPNVSEHLKDFQNFINWRGPKKDEPYPAAGISDRYDEAHTEVEIVKGQLNDYLDEVRARLKDQSIEYTHSKYRFELEIQEKTVSGNRKPDDFEFTSSQSGYQRFHTQIIQDLVRELEEVEVQEKEALTEFVCLVFQKFQERYRIWDGIIQAVAELDCLCSLSIRSFLSDGSVSRPQLIYADNPNDVVMDIQNARHPCVTMLGVNFIPNTIQLGNINGNCRHVSVLTGPNMGGKSTTLRMACIIAILAQIGCYVPASKCQLSIIDRIFTRIGASDKLADGKSTFFIEMEETKNICKFGTHRSFAILDELGRGTSTFDGVAIAYSILEYLLDNLKCLSIFATHYHMLIQMFEGHPQLQFNYMVCFVDEKNEKVIFNYQLKEGTCAQSFGINVAQVVGIKKEIIDIAKVMANEFEEHLNHKRKGSKNIMFKNLMETLFGDNCDAILNFDNLDRIFEGKINLKTPTK